MANISIRYQSPQALTNNPHNARRHGETQLAKLAISIRQFGFLAPVLVDASNRILAGHARVEAACTLGLEQIPTICAAHLSEAQCRAYMLADNKIADLSGYDEAMLADEFEYLLSVDTGFEITDTGFEIGEIDVLIERKHRPEREAQEELPFDPARVGAVCRSGDLWQLGEHRLFCGDALDPLSYQILLGGERADMVFTDPPFNLPIPNVVSGLGKVKHGNFKMACGEMTDKEFAQFLTQALRCSRDASRPGSLHYVCMDWRQIAILIEAGREIFDSFKALCVWNKGRGGMGSPYRSAHELIALFKHGKGPHLNNIQLGAHGRNRTNVWTYPGMNSFGRGRAEKLSWHPTVKNLAMVADAILDCTKPGDLVLDGFGGSGTTLLAAHRTRRRAAVIELDPVYCDRALRRFCDATGIEPVNAWTGMLVKRSPLTNRGEEL